MGRAMMYRFSSIVFTLAMLEAIVWALPVVESAGQVGSRVDDSDNLQRYFAHEKSNFQNAQVQTTEENANIRNTEAQVAGSEAMLSTAVTNEESTMPSMTKTTASTASSVKQVSMHRSVMQVRKVLVLTNFPVSDFFH
jgi:hypothetical protein